MCGGVPILNPMLMMEHQQMKQGKQQQAVNAFPQAITHHPSPMATPLRPLWLMSVDDERDHCLPHQHQPPSTPPPSAVVAMVPTDAHPPFFFIVGGGGGHGRPVPVEGDADRRDGALSCDKLNSKTCGSWWCSNPLDSLIMWHLMQSFKEWRG